MNVQILRTLGTNLLITTVAVNTHYFMCICWFFLTERALPPDVNL